MGLRFIYLAVVISIANKAYYQVRLVVMYLCRKDECKKSMRQKYNVKITPQTRNNLKLFRYRYSSGVLTILIILLECLMAQRKNYLQFVQAKE